MKQNSKTTKSEVSPQTQKAGYDAVHGDAATPTESGASRNRAAEVQPIKHVDDRGSKKSVGHTQR